MSVTSTCNACGATYRGAVETCPNCHAGIERAPELRPGQTVDGKYEILSLIGVGGMGEVFKVRHIHLNALRTIKVMRRTLVDDETYRNRFAREARLATLLQHPNVALVHDFAMLPDGSYYMVSEYIEGVTVRQWAALHGRISPGLAVNLAVQTLNGLDHIHRAGLLHRDLSADNIMISSHGDGGPVAKIIDLGIAKQVTASLSGDGTQAGIFVGNPRYSSPEQLGALADGDEVDARADLYCFGVVLYEMLAGVPPFVSRTPEGYAAQHLAAVPPPLLSQPGAAGVPAGLQGVVAKALQKNRENRYGSAREFAAALTPFLTESISETTQMKISALQGAPLPHRDEDRDPFPVTMMPPPGDGAEHQAWEQAAARGTREDFQEFLHNFPSGPNAAIAHARLDEVNLVSAIERMAEQGDVSSLSRLASVHAGGTRIGKAVRTALDRMADDSLRHPGEQQRAWDLAARVDTEASWGEFLAQHPDSPRALEARLRRDELRDFGNALRRSTVEAWHAFLQSWPESRYRPAAYERLRVLQEDVFGVPDPPMHTVAMPLEVRPSPAPAPAQAHAPAPVPAPVPRRDLPLVLRLAIEAAIVLVVAAYLYFNVRAAHAQADDPPAAVAGQTVR